MITLIEDNGGFVMVLLNSLTLEQSRIVERIFPKMVYDSDLASRWEVDAVLVFPWWRSHMESKGRLQHRPDGVTLMFYNLIDREMDVQS